MEIKKKIKASIQDCRFGILDVEYSIKSDTSIIIHDIHIIFYDVIMKPEGISEFIKESLLKLREDEYRESH